MDTMTKEEVIKYTIDREEAYEVKKSTLTIAENVLLGISMCADISGLGMDAEAESFFPENSLLYDAASIAEDGKKVWSRMEPCLK